MFLDVTDVIKKGNNGIEIAIYFSHHSIQRMQQRIESQASESRNVAKIADSVADALLRSCYVLDETVRFNEAFKFILNNEVYVCKYGIGEIFIKTAFVIEDQNYSVRVYGWKKRGFKVIEARKSIDVVYDLD